jgi:hypothetical protein
MSVISWFSGVELIKYACEQIAYSPGPSMLTGHSVLPAIRMLSSKGKICAVLLNTQPFTPFAAVAHCIHELLLI